MKTSKGTDNSREGTLLKKLYKELRLKYPPHHYKHVRVWDRFWNLVDALNIDIEKT
ncbi:MAG: hypothetical protein P9M03_09610 [Candidatus Theseobacter exili]|nr:hypothetical protein [Candidatus Theseobacter exili]